MSNPFNLITHPNCHEGHGYALDILNGKIRANIYLKAACKRYVKDLEENDRFYFDKDKAEKYLRTVQRFFHHVGHWETLEIIYEPWQKWLWMNVKGFISYKTGFIRFRTAHIDVARGNAKSTMASQAALYELGPDEPNGNRVYCAATSRDQAREVLNGSQIMANKNKSFTERFGIEVMAHEVLQRSSNSYIKAISAQANSLDGKIGKLVITDELHAMQRKTFETLDSGQSKRRDSLLLSITTAGYASDGVGYSQRSYAQKVALGEIEDDTFFAAVYRLDEEDLDDPYNKDNYIKANPNLGVSVDPDNFLAKAKKAEANPEDAANFKIKHLNMYLDSMHQFYDVRKWSARRNASLKMEDFKGEHCFVGVDIASKIDITSVCYLFKREEMYYPFWFNYVPEEQANSPKRRRYQRFIEQGDLIATTGEVVNLPKIEDIIINNSKVFKINDLFADPWNAVELTTRLSMENIETTEYRMNVANFSEPMKKLDAIIRDKKIEHNTQEFMEWVIGNVVAKYDAKDNVFPNKEHQDNKIDPAISLMMALSGWLSDENKESVYETRGIISF